MDYDDADFQSQNFQPTGEENNKFPLSLRPFALPKFDIDDQLQGHLRFDNLIESEVFFGVQSQDNWIEGLSTGSSVVDFSSSAAESCSISRTNNVWSEATSTESVEMLLKSVGENEMIRSMDSNAHNQLNDMDSQVDPLRMQDKSSNSPTGNIVAPNKSSDPSRCTLSGVTEDPSISQPPSENKTPMDEKAEHVVGSTLSDGKSNSMAESVANKYVIDEKLSSASNKTSKSHKVFGDYFEVDHDGSPLGNLKVKVPLTEADSKKLNNQSLSELAPLQDIYATDSYHLKPENQQVSAIVVTPEVAECHRNEQKVEGNLPELKSFSCTSHPLNSTKLSGKASNETLLSENSDGLLEAITNPVMTLQKNDDTCIGVGVIQHPSFSQVEHVVEGLKGSVDRNNEYVIKELDISEKDKFDGYCQLDSDSRNSNPHLVTPLSNENSELVQSPKDKQLAYVPEALEETKNAGMSGTNDGFNDKLEVKEQHQDSVDPANIHAVVEKKNGKEIIAGLGDIPLQKSEQTMKSSEDDNTKGSTDASKDKLDSLGGVLREDSLATLLDEKHLKISSISNEVPIKEGATPALEDKPGNNYLVSPLSGPQGKNSAPLVISSGDGASSIVTDVVAKNTECKELVTLDSLSTRETQKELGFDISTKIVGIHSVNHSVAYPQQCPSDTSSIQSAHHKDLASSSATLDASSDKSMQEATETSPNAKDDNANLPVAEHSPSPTSSKSRADSLGSGGGDGDCAEATCGSPTVISCSKPCPQEGVEVSNALLDHITPAKSEDPTASADTVQSSKGCSSSNVKPTQSCRETKTTEDDRSFSFVVEALPNLPEKVHSPDWKPFPSSKAAHNSEAMAENPQTRSPPGSSLKNTSEGSKKKSTVGAGKEQSQERLVAKSQGDLIVGSAGGDITKTKGAPSEMQQRPIPESSTLAHQPFTDVQHVQLRAQIFVYGALIQGIPPAEAYMMSAFGEPVGGGKPAWDAVWQAAVERFQGQKSPMTGLETPIGPRLGSCAAEQGNKDTAAKTAPASKSGCNFTPSAHSAGHLHLPKVDMSPLGSSAPNLQRGTHLDFSQVMSPVFTYHSSQMRQPTSTVSSWFPQSPGPRPAPWLVPPQTLIFDSSTQLPAAPTTETTKVTPSKILSISHAVLPGAFLPSQGPSSSPLAVIHDERQKAPDSTPKRGNSSQKPRKRKKASKSSELQPVITASQLKTDPASVSLATKHPSGFTLSTHSPSNILGAAPVPSAQINYQIVASKDAEQRVIFSEQICSAIEQSKGQFEGAAKHAMDALRHREGVWSQLSANSGNILPSEVKEKLASAATAAAAAASVAKAAAAAAKMASEAALQAKMMADEALSYSQSVNSLQKHETGKVDVNSNWEIASSSAPVSTRKVKNKTPSSIISVAREVARKRLEEASAAAKCAENFDAILKAAELAAEAVSQAGTIISMGDPIPFTLSELLEAGPDGYWKSYQVKNKKSVNPNNIQIMESLELDVPDDNKSGKKGGSKTKRYQAMQNMESSSTCKELLQLDGVHSGNGIEDVPTTAPLNVTRNDTTQRGIIWNGIEKGSVVEVLAGEHSYGGIWFYAKVLDINENNVCISYNDRNEGADHHEEWVPLESEGGTAPRIRLARPVTTSKSEGTRKRRREVAGNYSWAIGDHVDAWIKDSWREGVIAQNCQGDESKLVVQFPAGGDSLVVNSWNLRPSLVWMDGQWIEWSHAQEKKTKSSKGDSPCEKRQKTGLLQSDNDPVCVGEPGGAYTNKNINNQTKVEEHKPLALSDGDMLFNVGKSVIENKADALRPKRSGPKKEGSRVVIGVPRPGKRRKFMEVSKHYVVDQVGQVTEGNAPASSAKDLMPRTSRQRDSTVKVDRKGRMGEMRSRGLKPAKSQNTGARNPAERDPSSMAVPSSGASESSFAFGPSTRAPLDSANHTIEKNSVLVSDLRTEHSSISESQTQTASGVTTKKNLSTADRAKRRFVPSVEPKPSEILGKASSESVEPRRSNRRIQPTSRLLEGLQSSLLASKVPGEKGARSHHRSTSSRGRAHG